MTDILSSLHQPLLDKPNKRSTLNSVVNKNPSFDMILKASISQFSVWIQIYSALCPEQNTFIWNCRQLRALTRTLVSLHKFQRYRAYLWYRLDFIFSMWLNFFFLNVIWWYDVMYIYLTVSTTLTFAYWAQHNIDGFQEKKENNFRQSSRFRALREATFCSILNFSAERITPSKKCLYNKK